MDKLTPLLKKLNIPAGIHSKVTQLLVFFAANPHYLNIVMKQLGESKMDANEKLRKSIREEIKNQLKEYSFKDYVVSYQGTSIVIKNAYKYSDDEKMWNSIYEKLATISLNIARQTKAKPKEISITL